MYVKVTGNEQPKIQKTIKEQVKEEYIKYNKPNKDKYMEIGRIFGLTMKAAKEGYTTVTMVANALTEEILIEEGFQFQVDHTTSFSDHKNLIVKLIDF